MAVGFGITIAGILIVTALIGVLTTGLDAKLAELRKGRSAVIESNHTVLLGWSDQVFTIIPELVKANANQRRSCVAILADRDKVEMDDEIRAWIGSTGNTRVVCRSGSPIDSDQIALINPQQARSVIILPSADDEMAEDRDAYLVTMLLAVSRSRSNALTLPRWARATTNDRDRLHQDARVWESRSAPRLPADVYEARDTTTVVEPKATSSVRSAIRRYRRLWLLGDPGSGKTWSLELCAADLAEEALDRVLASDWTGEFDVASPAVPVRLGMRELAAAINGRLAEAGYRESARLEIDEFAAVVSRRVQQALLRPWTRVDDTLWEKHLPEAIRRGRVHLLPRPGASVAGRLG